jgi:hypothetical protein
MIRRNVKTFPMKIDLFAGSSFNLDRQDRGLMYDCCAEQKMRPTSSTSDFLGGRQAECRSQSHQGLHEESQLGRLQILRAVAPSIGSGSEEPCFRRADYEAMSGVYNVWVSPEK